MSYTTVYRFQDLNGYESVISKANSDMTYEGFGRILLNPGQTLEYKVTGEEQAIVLQQGDMTCWVEYEGVTVVAPRASAAMSMTICPPPCMCRPKPQ